MRKKKSKSGSRSRLKVVQESIEFSKKVPFFTALANKMLEQIGFTDLIDESVKWDKNQCNVSPGNLLKSFVLSTFMSGIRSPLSNVQERYEGIDTEILFGEGVLQEHLNDDAIGRSLDKLAKENPASLFGTLCLSAYSKYDIEFKRLHSDTTTVSFYGDYNTAETGGIEAAEDTESSKNKEEKEEDMESPLQIVRGYNKDHRPECKQVVIGKIVSEHGVPLYSEVMDGNTSDVEWNDKAVKMTREIFGERINHGIYIADCKLIHKEMVKLLTDPERPVRFISRCPANFHNKLAGKFTSKAYQDDNWIDLGSYGSGKKACTYKGCEYQETIYGRDIRVLVIQSSNGHAGFLSKKEKQLSELETDVKDTNKKIFVCKGDAKKEWERFQKKHKNSLYQYTVEYVETKTEKRKRGNPGKNPEPPEIETKWNLNIQVTGENEEKMNEFRQSEESFVLITNVKSEEKGIGEILGYYKDQYVVEVNFRYFKEPCLASVIYLKNEERINALMMLLSVSLLVRALMQYMMRRGYKENKDPLPKVGWNGAALQPGLTVHFLSNAMQNEFFIRGGPYQYYYVYSNPKSELRVQTLLKLMGMTAEELLE